MRSILSSTRRIKAFHLKNSGSTVYYWYDEPIFPEKFATLQEFEQTVSRRFNKSFNHVMEKYIAERGKTV